jgi:branched-chain amino acid transport system permease protein
MSQIFTSFESFIDKSIGRRNLAYAILALVVVYLLWFPQDASQSNYGKTVYLQGFFYAIMASSWALLAGISGQFSFGHMAFMGIGAYASGLIARDGISIIGLPGEAIPAVVAIFIGTVVAGLVGLLIGWALLRLRSSYLALFTIAFSEIFRIAMLTEYDYTGGSNGLSLRPLIQTGDVNQERIIGYYVMFGLLLVSLALMYFISNSRIGLFLRAMREDEDAASALGVNVLFYKVLIFVITSMIIGLAGSIFYSKVGSERIIPEQLEILSMSLIIAYAVIGGMESLLGAAAGAFISLNVLEALRKVSFHWPFGLEVFGSNEFSYEPGALRYAVFGVVLVLTLRFMRNGLLFPILQWFEGRDTAMQETVSKRKTDDDEVLEAAE